MAPVACGMEKRPCYCRVVGLCTWHMSPVLCFPEDTSPLQWQKGTMHMGRALGVALGTRPCCHSKKGRMGHPQRHMSWNHVPAPLGGTWPQAVCRGDTSSSNGRKGQRTWNVPPMARGAGDVSQLWWVEGTVHVGYVADGTCCGGMSLLSWGGGTAHMGHSPDGRCCWRHVLALRVGGMVLWDVTGDTFLPLWDGARGPCHCEHNSLGTMPV